MVLGEGCNIVPPAVHCAAVQSPGLPLLGMFRVQKPYFGERPVLQGVAARTLGSETRYYKDAKRLFQPLECGRQCGHTCRARYG